MHKKTFIGGYWKERPENIYSVAERLQTFFLKLDSIDELFSNFKFQSNSKKEAMKNNFVINPSTILQELMKRRKKNEIDEKGFCDIGFSFTVFNEAHNDSIIVSCTVGASNKYINNVCYIDIKGQILNDKKRENIEFLIRDIFTPDTIKSNSTY